MADKISGWFRKREESSAAGQPLVVRTYKNGVKLNHLKIEDREEIKRLCGIVQNFDKWSDYHIVYDLPQHAINIYFTVKKTADFENIKNDKEEKG